ncbi:breast carcinoma-amplified sequence 4 isoform X1 [Pteropus alecto]|uniref:breast carcinoma-amplified sequence 4 isoform X1 n=1 Tax=Pteropus alecto TaxID=9402 RepID=UPI000D535751|nr:breast carcinoma-amplified sequence 4 isoform X1 [Pteropus alecto]XP_024895665.1 breast carcinoma-amplified sequence 4 isoform X1 [Pteropus alecto]
MGAKEAVGDQWPLGGQGPAPFRFFAVPSGDARIGTLGEGRTRKKKVRTTVHAKEVEETIEGLLLRLEEFCSLTDMIRSDTSQILEENIPLLKAKVTEMRGIYTKVDQLEAFVKMVGRHVSFLEDHVLQAERDHGAFSQALRRWLGSAGLPRFRTQRPTRVRLGVPGPAPSRVCQTRGPQASLWQLVPGNASQPGMKLSTPAPLTYELPTLYRTEDYFPVDAGETAPQTPSHHRRL